MKRLAFLNYIFLSLFSLSLNAGIETYFKSCPNKNESQQVKNIDFIYMINLDRRPEKFQCCLDQLAPYDIIPYRFSAIDGKELTSAMLNELGIRFESWMKGGFPASYFPMKDPPKPCLESINTLNRTYFSQSMGTGTIAIILSHLSVLQDAYDSGYKTIWLMEDDIEVIQDPHLLSPLIDKLDALTGKDGWDILFTDRETKNKQGNPVYCLGYGIRPNYTPQDLNKLATRQTVNAYFRKIGARYGAYSMIIRRSGIKKLLNFFKEYKIFLPYDIDFFLPPDLNLYTVSRDVVSTQPKALSDNDAPRLGLASASFQNSSQSLDQLQQLTLDTIRSLQGWSTSEKISALTTLICVMNPTKVVEIGVFGGKSLIPMAQALKSNGIGKIYGIDPWSAEESAQGLNGNDRDWWLNLNHIEIFRELMQKMTEYGLQSNVEIINTTSAAAPLIDQIDLLNIDGNHSAQSTYFDVLKWVPALRTGGIIVLNLHSNSVQAVQWLNQNCVKIAEGKEYPSYGIWIKP